MPMYICFYFLIITDRLLGYGIACWIMLWHHMGAFRFIETDCFPLFIVDNNPLRKLCCALVTIITSSWLDKTISIIWSFMYRIPTCLSMRSVIYDDVTWSGLHSAQLFWYIQCWRVLLIVDNIVDHKRIVLTCVCLDFIIPISVSGLQVGCIMNYIIVTNHCRRHVLKWLNGCCLQAVSCQDCSMLGKSMVTLLFSINRFSDSVLNGLWW